MPLKRCQSNGKMGHKWGDSGKCFIGPESRQRAINQGRAIQANKKDQVLPLFTNSPEQKKETIRQRREQVIRAGGSLPRPTKIPPNMASTATLERSYYSSILSIISPVRQILQEVLLPSLPAIIDEFKRETRVDTFGETITQKFGDINIAFSGVFTESELGQEAEKISLETSDFNRKQVDKQFSSVLAVSPIRTEQYLIPLVDSFVERNVGLIKSIPEEFLKDVEILLRTRIEQGATTTSITKEIKEKFQSTKKRAKLIARDQIGKFHGKLSELRQTEVGVTHYFWETSDDERVRPRHAAVDGKRFSWKSPPAVGAKGAKLHPGQDFQCRCWPRPDLTDFFASSITSQEISRLSPIQAGFL